MLPPRVRCLLTTCIFAMSCCSCTHKRTALPAYYFWRSGSDITATEKDLLRRHQIHTLYSKVLDIGWDNVYGAIPLASFDINEINRELHYYDSVQTQIVPVVFITNETFSKIDSLQIPELAKRVIRRCLPAYDGMDIAYEARDYRNKQGLARPREIQFDCDWTVSTAKKYFFFLQTVRRLLPSDTIRLSATIRLHQYKYQTKTGVPPVERGMLMVYNISDLTQYSPVNSIFDKEKAAAYFGRRSSYPLPLDVVLPAWSWGLVFRNKKFYQIENGLHEKDLKESSVLERIGPPGSEKPADGVSFYRVKKDTVLHELFLRPGDEIKIESIDSAQLAAAAALARRALNTDTFHLALFELSSSEIRNISDETLTSVYSSYR